MIQKSLGASLLYFTSLVAGVVSSMLAVLLTPSGLTPCPTGLSHTSDNKELVVFHRGSNDWSAKQWFDANNVIL